MAQITKIDPITFEAQSYSPQDEGLILSFPINTELQSTGYIEFYVYDFNNNLINQDINFKNYRIENSGKSDSPDNIQNIIISPEENLKNFAGTGGGQYIGFYNFLNYEIGDNTDQLFISEISSDRTEIRLESNSIPNLQLIEAAEDFIDKREESQYFLDFYLNFGNNTLIIANNIKTENEETDNPSILVKLYEPLPSTIGLKSKLFLVTTINEPEAYRAYFEPEPTFVEGYEFLKGPNFAIPIKNQVNNSSQNLSYTDIISSASTGSQNQIDSLLSQSAINISVDYNNFSDFINFSSAQTRIENFYYKVGLIETYTSESNALTNTTGSTTSKQIIETKISNIITNFDQFEYFMYYSSGSTVSYPKSNSTQPYTLYSTGSTEVLTWLGSANENSGNFGGLLLSASNYDDNNPDQLKKSIPEYLREDPANQQYDLFVDMVAQYYDNVWLYTKDITQKYNADNRLDFGVSKDLVSDAIKDFGVKLYQNNFSNQELYTAFLGITPEGSLFPFPEITGSLPTPTGFEFVDTLISASNDVISMDDTNKSLYKRIYHNIPYLLKSKGTLTGLRALITSYGIPDTILKISEFGGKDQVNANDYDLYFNNFNYAFNTENNFISSSWEVKNTWLATNNRPSTVQFRFKSEEISSNTSPFGLTNLSQSLWYAQQIGFGSKTAELLLEYSGSGLNSGSLVNDSGSYDGSIKDPNYQYANLKFIPYSDQPNISASISLPFYNNDWWSVMVTTDQNNTFNLYAGNKIYNGNDGTSIGYYASASITGADSFAWRFASKSVFASSSVNHSQYKKFSGSLQEIRYYNTQISENVFKDYVMNPLSFEGNGINSAPDQLIFRAALGSELDINTSSSIHPKVTGSWTTTSSFSSDSNFYFSGSPQYSKNTEYFFLDQPAVGIKNRTTDKIRSENATIPGNTLSPIKSLSQYTEASASYTDNINYLEVAFSPQNQINDDIIDQMGHFNIGDYIGDPAQRFTGNNYPDLNDLSEEYFKKYIKQYDLVDFVRLIKFFDNSLFKMIKDFVPARTSLASGLVIKQHLLERNKYPQPSVSYRDELLSGSIQSKQIWDPEIGPSGSFIMSSSLIESFNGGAAGMFNPFNISYDLDYVSGSVTTFFNVSASSGAGLSLGNGETFISGSDGPPITNASSLSYFNAFAPNLYVQINSTGGTLVPFSFNSGSKPGPVTPVSASFGTTGVSSTPSQINVTGINSNSSQLLNFSGFDNGFVVSTPAIFNNPDGNVLTNSSSINSISSLQLITTFPTRSIFSNVSASGTFSTSLTNKRTNFSSQNTNVNGGIFSNFSDFAVSSFVSASSDIFSNPSGSLEIISASGNISFVNGSTNVLELDTFNSNAVLNQFTQFPGAFIVCSKNIFDNGLGTAVNSSQISSVLSATQIQTSLNTLAGEQENVNFDFRSGSSGGSTSFNKYSEGNSDKAMITNIDATSLSTEFTTSSFFTNVSASGTITFNGSSGFTNRFDIDDGSGASNVSGGDMANFQEFINGGYITVVDGGSSLQTIFDNGSGVAVASSEVVVLGTNEIRTAFNTSSINTPVSGSGTMTFNVIAGGETRFTLNSESTNVTGNSLANFQTFKNDGYIIAGSPIFSGSGFQSLIPSQSVSFLSAGEIRFTGTNVLGPLLTPVSASGTGNFNPSPAGAINLISTFTNASDFNFSGFDDGNAYISCSANGSGQYPFAGAGEFGSGVALITSCNSTTIEVSISGRNSGYTGSIQFAIMSGSAATNNTFTSGSVRDTSELTGIAFDFHSGSFALNTDEGQNFISSSARTIDGLTFNFRTGSLSQGAAGSTTFISESGRNLNGINFEIFSGSYDNLQTFTSLGNTYISESARNIVGTSFQIHSGSLTNDLGIIFQSSSLLPLSHSRAQVASIGADNVINFTSNWSINSDGEVAGEEFQLFNSLNGSNNIFASASTQFTFRNNQLNSIPTPIFDITQSYNETFFTAVGPITKLHSSQDEFYDGELSGSVILVSNGELNEGCADFKEINPFLADYKVRVYPDTTSGMTEGRFLQNQNLPIDGYIQIFYGEEPGNPLAPIFVETSKI